MAVRNPRLSLPKPERSGPPVDKPVLGLPTGATALTRSKPSNKPVLSGSERKRLRQAQPERGREGLRQAQPERGRERLRQAQPERGREGLRQAQPERGRERLRQAQPER